VRLPRAAALLAALLLVPGCGGDDAGKVVKGSGYEVTVPAGWEDKADRREDVEFEGFTPDVLLVGDREDGFTTNVNILRNPSAGYSLDRQVRAERDLLEVGRLPGSDAEPRPAEELGPVERIELGGEPARAYDFRLEQEDKQLDLRQVVAIHDKAVYAITLTTGPDRRDDEIDSFEAILDSWRWR
jgi:hypothetical protein